MNRELFDISKTVKCDDCRNFKRDAPKTETDYITASVLKIEGKCEHLGIITYTEFWCADGETEKEYQARVEKEQREKREAEFCKNLSEKIKKSINENIDCTIKKILKGNKCPSCGKIGSVIVKETVQGLYSQNTVISCKNCGAEAVIAYSDILEADCDDDD